MERAVALYQTTIGKKAVMAVSGVIWVGYLVAHMAGNLLVFAGPEPINDYSQFLHESPGLLWTARLVLIGALVAHVVASTQLTMLDFEARPVPYARRDDVATNYAARTMFWSGPLILLFLVYHILHLTIGAAPGTPYDPHHVYNNLVLGFRIPWVTAAYVVALGAIALHLYHGVWSFFQTLGANHPRYNPLRRRLAALATLAIVIGFLAVPIASISGILRPAGPTAAMAQPADRGH